MFESPKKKSMLENNITVILQQGHLVHAFIKFLKNEHSGFMTQPILGSLLSRGVQMWSLLYTFNVSMNATDKVVQLICATLLHSHEVMKNAQVCSQQLYPG